MALHPFPLPVILLSFLLTLIFSAPAPFPSNIRQLPVPRNSSRFDLPWREPPRIRLLSLSESRHRILYSGVREGAGDGLGHSMAILNAEFMTALRLGLTYTHRTARYGSLVPMDFKQRNPEDARHISIAGLPERAGKVEGFFGWGVGEVPREAVQEAACLTRDGVGGLDECKICTQGQLDEVNRMSKLKGAIGHPSLRMERVVEVPMELSYKFGRKKKPWANGSLVRFLTRFNQSNTLFHMPHEVCAKSPTHTCYGVESRSWFFHKYWDAHGRYALGDNRRKWKVKMSKNLFRESWTETLSIPGVPGRDGLRNLREHDLTIAVHARRGDFFKVGRPMVAMKVFGRVVRQVVAVVKSQGGVFAAMPVKVNVYSEGLPTGGTWSVGHDVSKQSKAFRDSNGKVLSEEQVDGVVRDGGNDGLGDLFTSGLKVQLRISEDTLVSLHEMIASDVFIGSMSAMSHRLVASLARGAVQLLPQRFIDANEWQGHAQFDGKTGKIPTFDLELVGAYWKAFRATNEASALRAVENWNKANKRAV